MEALHAAAAAGGGGGGGAGGGGGPAPFLLKTYEMVDDPSTDKIVSWSSSNTSFVVWNPPDFAERLLPTYFKHNNFSSFIRQLNTYGFRKIDADRWEFANEEFIKGQQHLLKNIHRRKPIHSHSHPPGGLPDAERAALEEEIDRLSRKKAAILADLCQFKQQQSGTRIQLDDLERRLADMEQRQLKMMSFLQHAIRNPKFVDNLVRMAAACSEGLIATHKKRRVPRLDYGADGDNAFHDNHSSSGLKSPEIVQVFNGDFSDKLKLELCPAISGSNLISPSTQSSNEDVGSRYSKQADRMECLSFVPESLDLADTGASICPRKNVLFPRTLDEGDDLISCHLKLTLASCSMQVDRGYHSDRNTYSVDERIGEAAGLRVTKSNEEDDLCGISQDNQSIAAEPSDAKVQVPDEATQTNNQAPAAPAGRVNDVFWEQFLTERPGATDAEEACSSLRTDSYDAKPEEKKLSSDSTFKNRKAMEQLSL